MGSTYEVLAGHVSLPLDGLVSVTWKWRGPYRVSLFLWRVASCCLPTNHELYRRHMAVSNGCPVCGLPKMLEPALRSCRVTRETWLVLSCRCVTPGLSMSGFR